MELKELTKFTEVEAKRLKHKFGDIKNKEKLILSSTVKIIEEFGELAELVLALRQRKEKETDNKSISDEFADVLIAVFMLAHDMDIDIEEALKKKIDKINKRYDT